MIKIVYNNQSFKHNINSDDYKSLLVHIKGIFKDLPSDDRLQLLTGYPPILLNVNSNDKVNISSGSILTIRDGDQSSIVSLEPISVFNLDKEKDTLLPLMTRNITINTLLTKGFTKTVILQALDVSIDDIELAESICNDTGTTISTNDTRKIKRFIIDADNSCLFNAFGYCVFGSTTLSNTLRHMIIHDINTNTDIYTNDILGKERNEYCTWLQNETSWGGEIEMTILSKLFNITINAIDIETNIVYKYEIHNNNNCVYLCYDGIHYDAIALSNDNDNDNITIFDKNDTSILNLVKNLAIDLKQQRQYVNINSTKFEIRCLVCSLLLRGQKEAIEHATNTGHQNFSQA